MINFSIITPVFNGAEYIEALIQSVLQQSYDSFEHIIIDDGSSDGGGTTSILAQYPHLRWWSRANRGQYFTMNEGLEAAQGEWVCFISADDLMSAGSLAAVDAFIKNHLNTDVIYGRTTYIDVHGSKHEAQHPFRHVPTKLFPYLLGISHCSMYVRRGTLLDEGLEFDETLRYNGDYDWILRLTRKKLHFEYIARELSQVRIHTKRASAVFEKQMIEERKLIFTRYAVKPWLYRTASILMRLHSASSKAISTFRTSGMKAVMIRFSRWLREKVVKTTSV
jgi:glycosyltransferase involved in cell wall biosynthesis